MIREEDPEASTRLSDSGEPPRRDRRVAGRRAEAAGPVAPGGSRLDRHEALEKDRARRYDSAGALADDAERYLAGDPVEASPPGLGYRLRKLALKHRAALAAAGLFVGLLATSAVVSFVLMLRARTAERLANDRGEALREANLAITRALGRSREAEERTRDALGRSEESRQQAEAVSTFLTDTFRSPDPALDGRSITVADLLALAAANLDRGFDGPESTRAALLAALASTYHGLGIYDRAVEAASRAHSIREEAFGPEHTDTLHSRNISPRGPRGAPAARARPSPWGKGRLHGRVDPGDRRPVDADVARPARRVLPRRRPHGRGGPPPRSQSRPSPRRNGDPTIPPRS
ncbi:MAG: hypothetical protein U0800_08460 [Isosphaeraceae bacterium]